MNAKKEKTYNSQVFALACQRLKLRRREKTIFYRLLGFLLRNSSPFPYSIRSMSDLTGYSESSIYECLNALENLRLIERVGFTCRVKFQRGSILKRICSLVQNRSINNQAKNKPLVQKVEKIPLTSPVSGYNKTFSSLKHKEGDSPYDPIYQEYVGKIFSDERSRERLVMKDQRKDVFSNSSGPKTLKNIIENLTAGS